MTDLQRFIGVWKQEHGAFVRVMRALPPEKLDYRPHERSRSAKELVWLMVNEEAGVAELIETGQIQWKQTPPEGELEDMISAYEAHHGKAGQLLDKLTSPQWENQAQFLVGGQVGYQGTVGDLLWTGLLDAIHHRGQLSVYLRPMGGKVPSIYGPTADDVAS